jgi:hypothetical protein
MTRLHLIELEDQRWLPAGVRHGVTAYLNFVANLTTAPYETFADLLAEGMRTTGDRVLLDLCSGSCGPLPTLLRMLRQRGIEARAVLTDLYPDTGALERSRGHDNADLRYHPQPVDATRVPAELGGFRLLCNGFHHFRPSDAHGILVDAVSHRRGIGLFEGVERRLPAMLVCAAALLLVPLATAFMRPWRWDRALLTYLLPIIPITVAWDGLVSCLRVYSPSELRALIAKVPGAIDYRWHVRRCAVPHSPFGVTCLVGYPRDATAA